jgi:transcription initiation factor IIF auxiliary subunit
MRAWSVEVWLLDDDGNQTQSNVFEKVVYKLHPSFPKPTQTIKKHPYKIEEKGWGEFDMTIVLHPVGKSPEHNISHDLNFHSGQTYESTHQVVRLTDRDSAKKND